MGAIMKNTFTDTPRSSTSSRSALPALNPSESICAWNSHAGLAMQRGLYQEAAGMLMQVLARLVREGRYYAAIAAAAAAALNHRSGHAYSHSNGTGGGVASRTRSKFVLALLGEEGNEDTSCDMEEDQDSPVPPMFLYTVPVNTMLRPASVLASVSADVFPQFVLYDQSVMTTSLQENQAQGRNERRLVAIFVFYNLALCLHYKEVVITTTAAVGSQDTDMLDLAHNFYRRALDLLGTYEDPGLTEDALFLRLAIYNNLGHLFSTMSSIVRDHPQGNGGQQLSEDALRCYHNFRTLLLRERTAQYPMNPGDWEFFRQSAMAMDQQYREGLGLTNVSPAA